MKRALVISGGGSKGAFAGGIAQKLLETNPTPYDMFLGTSTGSLLVSHLALGKVADIKKAFTEVTQEAIFDNNPFRIYYRNGIEKIKMNHINILKNFFWGRKTFGESRSLRELIQREIPPSLFKRLQEQATDVIVCVSNLSLNQPEFKTLKECQYQDFIDWIWISCNYVPFMSLVIKNKYEYADGGFGCVVAIEEAIKRGAREVDVIVLSTESQSVNRLRSRNPFDLLTTTFEFMSERIEKQNLHIGQLKAKEKNCQLRLFYTPRVLTTNSLVFNKEQMNRWWKEGYEHAEQLLIRPASIL